MYLILVLQFITGLMKKLKSSIKHSKQKSKKRNQTVSSMKTAYLLLNNKLSLFYVYFTGVSSGSDDDNSSSSTFTHQPAKNHKSTESSECIKFKNKI